MGKSTISLLLQDIIAVQKYAFTMIFLLLPHSVQFLYTIFA